MLVYVNGQWLNDNEATISILDRGFVFADAVYEVVRIYNGRYFYLDRHLQRLKQSLSALRIDVDVDSLEIVCRELLERNKTDQGSLYLQISRGAAQRVHGLPQGLTPTVVAYVKGLSNLDTSLQESGGKAIFYEDTRWFMCNIKTVGLLINCLAKGEALSQGADDAIFHRGEIVTEATSSNIFIVKNGTLYTHPNGNLILPGITRQVVIELAHELQIPVEEKPFTREELLAADELFLTGTMAEITPYVKVEGRTIGEGKPGCVTRRLQDAFSQLTRSL
ncbi:D-alanine aminotransferase [Collibacillus ludicampi]|uniref:D-alanine aminotransferase n=1 Tax=Collibacillus ludicampi TaxID=2771369 RepID=A0AAV4LAN6_9BACL|nr:D-amino-acid transaminase [Collibacillus ludicampi]GIM44778.1 D-alanine aminotransferase [Collibacillus ludicampi]